MWQRDTEEIGHIQSLPKIPSLLQRLTRRLIVVSAPEAIGVADAGLGNRRNQFASDSVVELVPNILAGPAVIAWYVSACLIRSSIGDCS